MSCVICGREDSMTEDTILGLDRIPYKQVKCGTCGTYIISEECEEDLPGVEITDDPLIRKRLARYLYDTRNEGLRSLFSYTSDIQDDLLGKAINLRTARTLYRDEVSSPLEKYKETICRLASRTEAFGHIFDSIQDRWLVPAMDDKEAENIIYSLAKSGYVETHHGQPSDKAKWYISITPKGLEHAEELGRQAKVDGKVVFIAACFNEDLKKAREMIYEVVRGLGYKPILLERTPHNNIIDLEIYEGIRQSKFIVADLTCNRQSVYYEVGFAHGLGLEAVLTCRSDHLKDAKDEWKKVHFDLSHRNILTWDDEDKLAGVLRLHIQQVFGSIV